MSNDVAGMMEGAYFVSRTDILNWLNSFLKINLKEVQETASGAVACQIMDAIYPNSIPMSKVDFSCRDSYEFVKNYKLLQACFTKNSINKQIDVERLIRGKYQDNFEFMQWLKWFFDTHYNFDGPEYDAVGRRSRSKGGREITAKMLQPKAASSAAARPSRASTPNASVNRASLASTTTTTTTRRPSSSNYGQTSPYRTNRTSLPGRMNESEIPSATRRQSTLGLASPSKPLRNENEEKLNQMITQLQNENNQLKKDLEEYKGELTKERMTSENIFHERDFYYYKLRDVEDLILSFEETNGANNFTSQLKQILYSDSNDNVDGENANCNNENSNDVVM